MELEPTGTRVPEIGSALSEGPYWKALQRHRLMVLKNLIPCDEFFQILASCRIFTSTIIENIKVCIVCVLKVCYPWRMYYVAQKSHPTMPMPLNLGQKLTIMATDKIWFAPAPVNLKK